MKLTRLLLVSAVACSAALFSHAQSVRSPENLGQEKTIQNLNHILVQNHRGENLGRIRDLNLDLASGRIIEVFVVTGDVLGFGGKTVAVPTSLLISQPARGLFCLNASDETFKSASAVSLSSKGDYRSSTRIVANARHFGVEPDFIKNDDAANRSQNHLGHIERANKLIGLPVGNFQNQPFGTVSTLNFSIQKGIVQSVIVRTPGFIKAESVIPPTAFSFNRRHTALLLDTTPREFAAEPRIVITDPANAQPANSKEELFTTKIPPAAVPQGTSAADIELAASIARKIDHAQIKDLDVHVITLDGRTVLRGSAPDTTARNRAFDIAIAASRLEVVDNQITINSTVKSL